jgi:hypothetical protein
MVLDSYQIPNLDLVYVMERAIEFRSYILDLVFFDILNHLLEGR